MDDLVFTLEESTNSYVVRCKEYHVATFFKDGSGCYLYAGMSIPSVIPFAVENGKIRLVNKDQGWVYAKK